MFLHFFGPDGEIQMARWSTPTCQRTSVDQSHQHLQLATATWSCSCVDHLVTLTHTSSRRNQRRLTCSTSSSTTSSKVVLAIVGPSLDIDEIRASYDDMLKGSRKALDQLDRKGKGGTVDLDNNTSRESRHQILKRCKIVEVPEFDVNKNSIINIKGKGGTVDLGNNPSRESRHLIHQSSKSSLTNW